MSTKNNHDLVKQEQEKTELLDLTCMFEIPQEQYKTIKDENPMGYYATTSSVWHVFENEDTGQCYREFICSRFEILKTYYTECITGNQKYMKIRFYDKGGICHDVDRISCSVVSKKRIDTLQEYGFYYNPQRVDDTIGLLEGQLFQLRSSLMTCYPGWRKEGNQMNFYGFDPDSYSGIPILSVSRTSIDGDPDESICLKRSEHIELINRLIAPSVAAQMVVTVGLSSAVLGYLCVSGKMQLNSPIIHLHGESSKGKTTALQLAASMWGKPDISSGLLRTWNSTLSKTLENLNNNNGVVMTLNEFGSNMVKNELSQLIYSIADGSGKDRMYNTNKTASTWNTVLLSCGETSLLNSIPQSKGLYARIFEFFNLDISLSSEHADEIKNTVLNNYGAIGRSFVRIIKKNDNRISIRYDGHKMRICKEIASLSSISSRVASLIAVFRLTADIAKCMGLSINPEEVENLFIKSHTETLERLPSCELNHEKLMSHVARNGCRFPSMSAYNNSIGNYDGFMDEDEIVFIDTAFQSICQKLNIDSKLFLNELKKNHYLDSPSDRLVSTKTLRKQKVKCYCIYKEPHIPIQVLAKKSKPKGSRKSA